MPPLKPPEATPTQSRSDGHQSGSTTTKADSHPDSNVKSLNPNLTTEADEERIYLQGDFGNGKSIGQNSSQTSDSTVTRQRRLMNDDEVSRKAPPSSTSAAAAARGVRERVLHMTPSWFSVTMGTGVIATLLNLLPWGEPLHSGLRWPALIWIAFDAVIFILFTILFLARYIMFPQVLPLTIKHPQKSMFLGTFPMGLIVIISNIAQLGTIEFNLGTTPALIASGLWWFATGISLLTAIGIPFVVTTYQNHSFSSTTATLLLPIVPPITAAATGSVIAQALMMEYPTYAFTIVVVSYMVLGIGLPMALVILVLYFQRLLLFKQPPREVIISVFLPLGPCGQGGEALLHLGQVAYDLFPSITIPMGSTQSVKTNLVSKTLTLPVGQSLFAAGLLGALLLWSFGIWWLFLALLTLGREIKKGKLSFNMGWWASTFPLGSLAICTARLAIVLNSLTLKIVYTILTIATFGVWLVVFVPTVIGFCNGSLLSRKAAPCIADLPLDPLRRQSEKQDDVQEDIQR
ncbi:unnamed protein product [Sympodiomycopsis kandeliae]